MATREKVKRGDLEVVRQKFLVELYSGQSSEQIVKKTAVRELMAPLMAARANGMSFEQMAELLAKSGLQLSSKTLRNYFFELKSDDQLVAEAQTHAARVARVGKAADAALQAKRQAHAERIAREHVQGLEQASALKLEQMLVSQAAAPPEPPAAVPATVSVASDPKPAAATKPAATGQAYTVAELEDRSRGTNEWTTLTEDLEVREGKVYGISGQAFEGFLTPKQLMVLRQAGKFVAPTTGRSSGSFVAMKTNL